jgi:NAD(P)-dependent dehydrogenase (short-subunit alcohol dehydrogenase family)
MAKTVFITGSSSGFGKDTADQFLKMGWNVVATMRNPEGEGKQENLLITKLDVTKPKTIEDSVNLAIERFGSIDVLINNAGYGSAGVIEAASDKTINDQFDVNLFGVIRMIKAVLPHMRKQNSGLIINVSSLVGKVAFPYLSLYNASKFALEGLTDALQFELNPLVIKLKLIEPGSYRQTKFSESIDFYGIGNLSDYQANFMDYVNGVKGNPDFSPNENSLEVAELIFEAATDNSNKFRYPIGKDTYSLLQEKEIFNDHEVKLLMAKRCGLKEELY